jgi:hypothetical protein
VGVRGLLFCYIISPFAAQRIQKLDSGTAQNLNRFFQHKGESLITNALTEI